jgi:hypothetical protein
MHAWCQSKASKPVGKPVIGKKQTADIDLEARHDRVS